MRDQTSRDNGTQIELDDPVLSSTPLTTRGSTRSQCPRSQVSKTKSDDATTSYVLRAPQGHADVDFADMEDFGLLLGLHLTCPSTNPFVQVEDRIIAGSYMARLLGSSPQCARGLVQLVRGS